MGQSQIWKILKDNNLLQDITGSDKNGQQRLAREVERKIVAVDLSLWLMQARNGSGLAKYVHSEAARCGKVVFERVVNCLRFGIVPCFVLEGEAAEAKAKCLDQRYKSQFGYERPRGSDGVKRMLDSKLCDVVTSLVKAMGLCVVQSLGEGEATCAALNASNLVDACVTSDVDAFLFGATKIYKTFNLSTSNPKKCALSYCEKYKVQHFLGTEADSFVDAMQMLMVLVGGDYNMGGCYNVGPNGAMLLTQHLVHIAKDVGSIEEAFWKEMEDSKDVKSQKSSWGKCTGCKRCGCEGGKKNTIEHHGSQGCSGCGTQPVSQGGNGLGGCVSDYHTSCTCQWHSSKEKRDLHKVISKVQKAFAENPDAKVAVVEAWKAYKSQSDKAAGLVEGINGREELEWRHRPDVEKIHEILEGYLEWDKRMVRSKLLPVLIEWDLCHSNPQSDLPLIFKESGVEITGIKESTRGAAGGDAAVPWRYLLVFERRKDCHSQEAEDDLETMKADGEKRCFRISCINKYCPQLVSHWRKRSVAARAKQKCSSGRTSSRVTATLQSNKITSYFSTSPRKGDKEPAAVGRGKSLLTQSLNQSTAASQSVIQEVSRTRRLQKLYMTPVSSDSTILKLQSSLQCSEPSDNVRDKLKKDRLRPIEESDIETPSRSRKISCIDMSSATKSRPPGQNRRPSLLDLVSPNEPQPACDLLSDSCDEVEDSFGLLRMSKERKSSGELDGTGDSLVASIGTPNTPHGNIPETDQLGEMDNGEVLATVRKRVSIVDLLSPDAGSGSIEGAGSNFELS